MTKMNFVRINNRFNLRFFNYSVHLPNGLDVEQIERVKMTTSRAF